VLKDLKQSTRQRFISLSFDYAPAEKEARIVSHEGNVDAETARKLVRFAEKVRNIREYGLTDGASSRLLIYAAQLIDNGIPPLEACRVAICLPLSDDDRLQETLSELAEDIFDA
jgi:nitric oxide reductase NorQ protein